jgi:branched-chain amino acid transport system substrate-binding protein
MLKTSSQAKSILVVLLALVMGNIFSGCSSDKVSPPPSPHFGEDARYVPIGSAMKPRPKLFPWERWSLEQDQQGAPLTNYIVLQGDQFFRQGNRRDACAAYYRARKERLNAFEAEALLFRFASCELAYDRPEVALSSVGDYFKAQKIGATEVDARFALLLAYAYGRKGDTEQSLAWFSHVQSASNSHGTLAIAAENGVSMLASTLSDRDLSDMEEFWRTNPFVRRVAMHELRRRHASGLKITQASGRPFDRLEFLHAADLPSDVINKSVGDKRLPQVPQQAKIGVLLPLSGQYAPLGINIRNGIEIALQEAIHKKQVALLVRDSGSPDATTGMQGGVPQFSALVDQDKASVILGPLLSETAEALVPLLEQRPFPMVTFAKRSDLRFAPGTFRLGPTAISQVESLLEHVVRQLGLTRIAVIYPSDSAGVEYAHAFRTAMGQLGLQPLMDNGYATGDITSLLSLVPAVEQAQPEAIFLPDTLDKAALLFSNLPPAVREKIRPLGPGSWDSPGLLQNSKTAMDGALFISPFFLNDTRDLTQRFLQAYQNKYGTRPDFLSAQGFDAASMVLAALRRDAEEGIPFLDAFREIDHYEGLTGVIAVEASGEVRRRFRVVELRAGVVQPIDGGTP